MHAADRVVLGVPSPSLIRLGLSVDADLLYRYLLAFGPGVAGQVERGLGLSPLRVAEGLDELVSVGAVTGRSRAGGVIRWAAVNPDDVVSTMRERQRPVPHRAERSARAPGVLPGPVSLGEGMRHLPSRALTRTRLAELVDVVRYEHLAMQPEPQFDAESARSAVPMDRTLLTRGVSMRVLGVHAPNDDPLWAHGRHADDVRPEYRQVAELSTKLIVMDRRTAFMPVSADNLDHGYLEITQEPVVAALVELFERRWATAKSRQEQDMWRPTFSAREQELLLLLALGHTDATAAAAMRISRRTVSNTVRDLMDRLGVENRFQLGLAVGSLGLVRSAGSGDSDAGESE